MSGRVVSFFKRTVSRDWSAQELAEFYRVEAALLQSGLRVSLDRGVTDEGDPWFVFCRAEDDEVIVHFARIDGRYLISAPGFGGNVTGHDFRALVRDMVERNPILRPARREENVAFHPSALLVMLVASALLKMSHAAEAAAVERPAGVPAPDPDAAPLRITIAGVEHIADLLSQESQQYVAVLSAIALALGPLDTSSMPVFLVSATAPGQPLSEHVSAPSHASPMDDWGASGGGVGGDGGGGGSVMPQQPATLPQPASDVAAHIHHELVAGQAAPAPIGGGATPSSDLTMATLPTMPPMPATMSSTGETSATSVTGPGLIQGNHDLAVSLLQAVGGNEPIVYSDTLPAAFVAPLHDSVHTSVATVATESQNTAAPLAVPVTAPTTVPVTTAPAVEPVAQVVVAGGAGDGAAPIIGVDTSFGAGPSASLIPVQGSGPGAIDFAQVLSLMQSFAQVVGSHLAILQTGNQVIEYDYFAIDYTPAAVSAVTYDFPDGSHVSLVGLRSELPHATV
jgi:hypothetical protein